DDAGDLSNRIDRPAPESRQNQAKLSHGQEFRHANQSVLLNARKEYRAALRVANDIVGRFIVRKHGWASECLASESHPKTDHGRNCYARTSIGPRPEPDDDFLRAAEFEYQITDRTREHTALDDLAKRKNLDAFRQSDSSEVGRILDHETLHHPILPALFSRIGGTILRRSCGMRAGNLSGDSTAQMPPALR